ncbi:MAG: WxcM-like domain-containing protein [Bacteroidetes bacterium]|nr:WxcM-like domain-containing protein [Bacteroidota bacterium]
MKIINFPKILDERGNLSFVQNKAEIPFSIKRVYWIYDVPGGEVRGGHAYKELEEVIIALSGSFDVAIDDGSGREQVFHLNRSYEGLYVPGMTWRQLRHFSTNAVALILASRPYEEDDYIYDYKEFKQLLRKSSNANE